MRKIATILFCFLLITGCSNSPESTPSQNIVKTQKSVILKLISGGKEEYIKSNELLYLTEEEVKQYRNDQLLYSKLTAEEYEKFKAMKSLMDKHTLNIVYNANVVENDNFFQKNIKSEAEFYIQNIEKDQVMATFKRPDNEDGSRQFPTAYKRKVLLKEYSENNYFAEVKALNKNKFDKFCGEQEGFIFYVDVIARKVIYIEKFWQEFCE